MKTPAQRKKFAKKIDALECALIELGKVCPAVATTHHTFVDGIYIREFFAKAGSVITGITHLTRHPFVISKGVVDVVNEFGDVTRYIAPFTGITEKGTRRVLFVLEDIIWTTFHRTNHTDPDEWAQENTIVENKRLPFGYQPQGLLHRKELTA